jgi:hypothetical protein
MERTAHNNGISASGEDKSYLPTYIHTYTYIRTYIHITTFLSIKRSLAAILIDL